MPTEPTSVTFDSQRARSSRDGHICAATTDAGYPKDFLPCIQAHGLQVESLSTRPAGRPAGGRSVHAMSTASVALNVVGLDCFRVGLARAGRMRYETACIISRLETDGPICTSFHLSRHRPTFTSRPIGWRWKSLRPKDELDK